MKMMQTGCYKILGIVFLTFFAGCTGANMAAGEQSGETNTSSQYWLADQPNESKSESHRPIIEIWQERDGSVPIRGKSLYFRMHYDGAIEFDYEIRKENGSGKPRYIFSIERTPPTKLSEEEFRKFKSLLEDLTKSKNIKQEYRGVALTLDVLTKLTILLKENDTAEQKIIINDSDHDVTYSKFEKIFPRPLISVFKEIQLIRNELTPAP